MTATGRTDERRSVDATGCEHATPIPTASRIGPLLASSVIVPFDVGTRNVPADPKDQVENVFRRAGLILAEAGAGWEHVARMTFLVAGSSTRDLIDAAWTEHFPDPDRRPARMTILSTLPTAMEIQCEFLAHVTP